MKLGQTGQILALLTGLLSACGDSSNEAPDASVTDAAAPADAGPDADLTLLSSRSLYTDTSTHTVAADAVEYTPVYTLWADGAAKQRWIQLPAGTQIDTTDMDHWQFPAGTRVWKEFSTPEGRRLETRLVEKLADGTFFFGAFVWNEAGTDAKLALNGASDVLGTLHDVPSKARCLLCHKGEAGRILGFSALQLSKDAAGANDPTLESLAAAGLLTVPPPGGIDYRFPGDATAKAALGYLHANCGHCHTPGGTAYMDTCVQDRNGDLSECMQLQFSTADANAADPLESKVMKSLLGTVTHSNDFPAMPRLTPHMPGMSAIYVRPSQRGGMAQMPPSFSTEIVDDSGVAAIEAFINSVPN
jgi:hypothetical protein